MSKKLLILIITVVVAILIILSFIPFFDAECYNPCAGPEKSCLADRPECAKHNLWQTILGDAS